MKIKLYLMTFGLMTISVVSTYFVTVSTAQQATQPVLVAGDKNYADDEYQVSAVLYMQNAAEYRALAYQAFNLAHWQLDADFDKKNVKKLTKEERKMPRAVVVDIDETVLDNSPQQVDRIKHRERFDINKWYAWGEKRSARAIPGAVDFLNYAASKGVKVFYVSNRDEVQKQATIDNLKSAGFPDATAETVLLHQTGEVGKETRRQNIAAKYRIVLLMGDNLDDFSSVFENKPTTADGQFVAVRFAETDKAREMFGKKFIVLPNAMYGSWENAVYDNKRDKDITEVQKAEKRANALILP